MINNKWDEILKDEFEKPYFINLLNMVKKEYQSKIIYPKYEEIFNALKLTSYENVTVVILGQDPYHEQNQAHGLSFSAGNDVRRPQSLNNIFKELYNDLGIVKKTNDLTSWAKSGILLLNSILMVEAGKPLSYKGFGFEIFTDEIIKKLNKRSEPIIFILWGNFARSKKKYITNKNHYIIESVHPSPLSANRGFFGSKPFSKTNQILKSLNKKEIKWE
ncbi:MAG: uracil-DNA glycosylase [Bacilli bacterium]